MKLKPAVPVLRIFDRKLALKHYVDWLGFRILWEHNLEGEGPCCLEVARDEAVLHLTEHYGDGSPGVKVYIAVDDVEAYHREISAKPNSYMRPGIVDEPWGDRTMEVIDPFGNRVFFGQKPAK